MSPDAPIVETAYGRLRGARADGVVRFLGVPYAAPPVGERRFEPPAPPEPWIGLRDATVPGPTPPQRIRAFPKIDISPLVGNGHVRGDDYLTLNVWAPDAERRGLPVMVFLHGGAWTVGHKDASIYDGSAFARSGVVMVAINYRLGVEGFLPIPGVPTNLGLRDQLAALRWVNDNIAAFGGDPQNVTAFGESAGAMSIGVLLASPLAIGLFRRAILQSGHASMVRPVEIARRVVRAMAGELDITPDRAGFESRSVEQCLDALEKIQSPTRRIDLRDAGGRDAVGGLTRFAPVWGDDVLPVRPSEAIAKGAGAEVQLLLGANAEEMNLYFVPTGVKRRLVWPLALIALGRTQPKAFATLRAYGLFQSGKQSGAVLTDAMSDLIFRAPINRLAAERRGRTHLYEFEWRSPACDGELGACHGIELPFVFKTLGAVTGPAGLAGHSPPQELADRTHAIWVEFARSGAVPWPPFDADERALYRIAGDRVVRAPDLPIDGLRA